MSKRQYHSLSDLLRQAIARSEMPLKLLERETGVQRASIRRFLDGETSLRLDLADKLAQYFGVKMHSEQVPASPRAALKANRAMRLKKIAKVAQRATDQLNEGNYGIVRQQLQRIARIASRD